MARLTKSNKESIIEMALAAAFAKEEAAHDARRAAAADALYEMTFGDAARIAERLPGGWVERGIELHAVADGYNSRFRSSRYSEAEPGLFHMSRARPVPWSGALRSLNVGGGHHMHSTFKAIAEAGADLRKRRADVKRSIETILARVTTTKALESVWPSGRRFYACFDSATPQTTAMVPIGVVEQIDDAIARGEA